MNLTNIRLLSIVLTSTSLVYSNMAEADHGSLGFGIGTAAPINTQTAITLPDGMWAGGILNSFISFEG